MCAAAITKSHVILEGLDINDTQGDKEVITMLKKMGAEINIKEHAGQSGKLIEIKGNSKLNGAELDLNNTPDALPALSVVGCCASGTTTLKNVAQARIKETDRIMVMRKELSKMGAIIKEMPDGLVIRQSKLRGNEVDGHEDHRVVMALSLAGLIAEGTTKIATAESIDVTFPSYIQLMGAKMKKMEMDNSR